MSLHKSSALLFSHPFLIEASSAPHLVSILQPIVDAMIPIEAYQDLLKGLSVEQILLGLREKLPLFKEPEMSTSSCVISYLCAGHDSHQARRYVTDTFTRWLIPGKSVEISGGISLLFRFVHAPDLSFFIAQDVVSFRSEQEREIILQNLGPLTKELKKKLPCEFTRKAEYSVHPVFMPRNEEELIRNLIILSDQIRFVRDLPQVSIHYEKQTDLDLIFSVLIAKAKKLDSLECILSRMKLKIDMDPIRTVGWLKQKYPKEGALIRVTVNKKPFFRADFSIDLLQARQSVVSALEECLGAFRDFNGGMILKQHEAFSQLKKTIGTITPEKEFYLEHYFYSLRPTIMQAVGDPSLLKSHFVLFDQLFNVDLKALPYHLVYERLRNALFFFAGAKDSSFKAILKKVLDSFCLPTRDLIISCIELKGVFGFGFILRANENQITEPIIRALESSFAEWTRKLRLEESS